MASKSWYTKVVGDKMKKIILVDGNNLLYRSYYATAYTGNIMKNSKNFPTNALFGFVSMINKIIHEENPEYMAVAFDMGKNFRSVKYDFYKDGRAETPDDLIAQMPYARKILAAMKVPYFELEPYEADDIIGTFARMVEEDPEFIGTIVSSDKDLLQLVSPQLDMKLLKQKDHIRYTPEKFKEDYGLDPIKMIDIKALAGDASDNIPGVKGIGEKTALTLLHSYGSLEGIYENIENIKGKIKEKLENDKDIAFMSKEIATIYQTVPLETKDLEDLKYEETFGEELYAIYEELEFYSHLKNMEKPRKKIELNYIEINSIDEIKDTDEYALYIELDQVNYHDANILGLGISTKEENYYIKPELLSDVIKKLQNKIVYTFDHKKNLITLWKQNISSYNAEFDFMIAAYLLGYNLKDDLAYLINQKNMECSFYETLKKAKFSDLEEIKREIILKTQFMIGYIDDIKEELQKEEMSDLLFEIENPLIEVLADMEYTGIKVDRNILITMKKEIKERIDILSEEIFELSGRVFNISSPKQLGEVLFEDLALPYGKKGHSDNYKTDVKVLHKLVDKHPIINKILEYRNVTKLYSTYLEGLEQTIKEDGRIHTIYKQNLTRTGRLSSTEPNLQNIPVRDEEGRKIRKAFIPANDCFLSTDYSQIELRILAHISNSKELIDAFKRDEDIHTKVASDINGIRPEEVTKLMRSTAKAVIFGIVYGISGFGLGENLEISSKDAKVFIDKYYELYPDVKNYMDNIVKKAYEQGYVRTLFGRKREIEELQNSNYMVRQSGERIALNTPIQGTSADIIKKAMVHIYQAFKENNIKSKMILQVHDELIFDCIEEEKEKVLEIATEKMIHAIELSVPLKVSGDYGHNWYEAK